MKVSEAELRALRELAGMAEVVIDWNPCRGRYVTAIRNSSVVSRETVESLYCKGLLKTLVIGYTINDLGRKVVEEAE